MEGKYLIDVGAKYSSLEELNEAIERYKLANFCQLYVRDSRTVASSLKRTPSRKLNESLCYSNITYSCIAGGKRFKSRSNGIRPNQRYYILHNILTIVRSVHELTP